MMAYQCDRCGQIYDWYETVYEDHSLNTVNNYELLKKYKQENGYYPTGFSANALKFMFFEPINTNCTTNKGRLTGEIEECQEGNNDLVMLCRDCMSEFIDRLDSFWERV